MEEKYVIPQMYVEGEKKSFQVRFKWPLVVVLTIILVGVTWYIARTLFNTTQPTTQEDSMESPEARKIRILMEKMKANESDHKPTETEIKTLMDTMKSSTTTQSEAGSGEKIDSLIKKM